MTILYLIFGATVWYFLGCLTYTACQYLDDNSKPTEKSQNVIIVMWPLALMFVIVIMLSERLENIHSQFMKNLKKFMDTVLKVGGK